MLPTITTDWNTRIGRGRRAIGVVLCALFLSACVSSHDSSGVYTVSVRGRISNRSGSCVTTNDRNAYVKGGTLCAGRRLGKKGQCISFFVSNKNAAHSSLPTVSRIEVLNSSRC